MKKYIFLVASVLVFNFVFAGLAYAQDKVAFTITPPLMKNNVNPGQIWQSFIKVVNNSDKEQDIYTDLVNFESGNETGTVRLNPLSKEEIEGNEFLINNWIVMEGGPYKVPPFGSVDIPFIVDVPDNADPGDHHIAILIGTRPPVDATNGSSMKISSMIGSLLLLNVSGDLNESGIIREFTTDKSIYSGGDIKFVLRFQNTGNSILQPQGEIRIFNFNEKDQGNVTINHKTSTGNVFPGDIRKWEYAWPVPDSLFKMGRYRADLLLAHGNQAREVNEMSVYFWVVQWKPVLITLGSILFFVLLIVLLVRRYIKKAILSTQEQIGIVPAQLRDGGKKVAVVEDTVKVVNLKIETKQKPTVVPTKRKKKPGIGLKFVVAIIFLVLLVISLAIAFYIYKNTNNISIPIEELSKDDLNGVIEIVNDSSESQVDVIVEETDKENTNEQESIEASEDEVPTLNVDAVIRVQNGSGAPGVAGKAEEILNQSDFKIQRTGNADAFDYDTSVIYYKPGFRDSADFIAEKLGVVADMREDETLDSDISIILGADFE